MSGPAEGLERSVHVRLVQHAKQINVDSNLLFTRFAVERFLYRLSLSPHRDRFILKGALLLLAWLGETLRPTRDADFLGRGELSDESLLRIFSDICAAPVQPDAMTYHPGTIRIEPIRPEDVYGGKRISIHANLGTTRLRVQMDIGIGDTVTPGPEWLEYPSLLDFPAPRLRAYPPDVVVAEKFHAMVVLGSKNSRMRDFFDVRALAAGCAFEGERLVRALRATFERRATPIPDTPPFALTAQFADVEGKRRQWRAFLERNRISGSVESLDSVVQEIAAFLQPPLAAAATGETFTRIWRPGGPWKSADDGHSECKDDVGPH